MLMCAHALGYPLFLHDGTDAYTTMQENDHYVLHNAAVMATTSNGYLT